MNSLRMLAFACLMYESQRGQLPATATRDAEGTPLLSWRVELLPYLEQQDLYDQFHHDEPWDSEHNKQLIEKMPEIFAVPGEKNDGTTRVMVFTGEDTLFPPGEAGQTRSATGPDGTAMTILAVQAGPEQAVPWTKPADLPFDPDNPAAALEMIPDEGILAVFLNGMVQRLSKEQLERDLKTLVTPSGGETDAP
jgi:hypothetical protein